MPSGSSMVLQPTQCQTVRDKEQARARNTYRMANFLVNHVLYLWGKRTATNLKANIYFNALKSTRSSLFNLSTVIRTVVWMDNGRTGNIKNFLSLKLDWLFSYLYKTGTTKYSLTNLSWSEIWYKWLQSTHKWQRHTQPTPGQKLQRVTSI